MVWSGGHVTHTQHGTAGRDQNSEEIMRHGCLTIR
jgi:hypothetical protein